MVFAVRISQLLLSKLIYVISVSRNPCKELGGIRKGPNHDGIPVPLVRELTLVGVERF